MEWCGRFSHFRESGSRNETFGWPFHVWLFWRCPQPSSPQPDRCRWHRKSLVNQYCAGCHNDTSPAGSFSWTTIDLANPARNAAQAEKVIRKLRAGMIPPAGASRPDQASIRAFVSAMETGIDRASETRFADAPELHRLNRTEYRNAIRDLLGLDMAAARS